MQNLRTREAGHRRDDREREVGCALSLRVPHLPAKSIEADRTDVGEPLSDGDDMQERRDTDEEDDRAAAREWNREIDGTPEVERPDTAEQRAGETSRPPVLRVLRLDEPLRRDRIGAELRPLDGERAFGANAAHLATRLGGVGVAVEVMPAARTFKRSRRLRRLRLLRQDLVLHAHRA